VDQRLNPYAPGAGRPPAALVGRDQQQQRWAVALDRIDAGRDAQPMVLYGLRGVGKTVLLSTMARTARDRDWMVVKLEAGAGFTLRAGLVDQLHAPLAERIRPNLGRRMLRALKTALSFKASVNQDGSWTFGVDLTETLGGGADTGDIELDLAKMLRDLAGAAREEGTGIAILIDEAQDLARDDLVAICAAAHEGSQEGWPVLFALAGLPSLPRILSEAKSYAERLFTYEPISALAGWAALAALTDPARLEGVEWEGDAVYHVVELTNGYPYFLQQYGQDIWATASGPPITLRDAELGAARAGRNLDNGFFRARWERATPAERSYLRAMAEDHGETSQSGKIADRLVRKPTSLGPVRSKLIAKGLIYAPEHGKIAFTVPGMDQFINRQHEF